MCTYINVRNICLVAFIILASLLLVGKGISAEDQEFIYTGLAHGCDSVSHDCSLKGNEQISFLPGSLLLLYA